MSQQELERLQNENEQLKNRLDHIEQQQKAKTRSKWDIRFWLANQTTTFFIGKNLKQSILQLYSELPGQVSKETMADVTTNLVKRLTRIGLFAFMVAFIPLFLLGIQTFLLSNQNEKLDEQNILFNKQNNKLDVQNELAIHQNKKIDVQINMAEANRRSNLIHLMSNIMDEMGRELREDKNKPGVRDLSDELIGRIGALNHGFKPYRYLNGDSLSTKALSPERGQLLIALSKSKLDKWTYQKIYQGTKFHNSDLRGANLNKANLERAELDGTDLSAAILSGANLGSAKLDGTDLTGANLFDANLLNVDLRNVMLEGADLSGAILIGANLEGVSLIGANLGKVFLNFFSIQNIQENQIRYLGIYSTFYDHPAETNLKNVNLQDVKVYSIDWFSQLDAVVKEPRTLKTRSISRNFFKNKPMVKGSSDLQQKYYVDTTLYENPFGRSYYLIKER